MRAPTLHAREQKLQPSLSARWQMPQLSAVPAGSTLAWGLRGGGGGAGRGVLTRAAVQAGVQWVLWRACTPSRQAAPQHQLLIISSSCSSPYLWFRNTTLAWLMM